MTTTPTPTLAPTYSRSQIVQVFAAAAQAACKVALDFSVGSIELSLGDACAAVGLWLQRLCLQLLKLTRAQTSSGADLDSWMAQWPLPPGQPAFLRLAPTFAIGQVTFSRQNIAVQAVILAATLSDPSSTGDEVQTTDGSQTFEVYVDTTNAAYSAALGGYVIPIGTASISVPAQALVGGTAGNVGIGAISLIASTIPGVDTVTNAAAFTGALNAESEAAFRVRFALNLQALATGNELAIEAAIANVQQEITYALVQNADYPGTTTDNGNFFVIINDGSGDPPTSLLNAVRAAILAVRGCSIRFQVYAPTVLSAAIVMTITTDPSYNHALLCQGAEAAISAYIQGLPLGTTTLPVTRLAQVAYDSSPGVTNVPLASILINSANADLAATVVQVFEPGVVTVS